jgi:hypothetical protein
MKVVQRTDLPKDHYTCEYQIMNYGRSPAILNFFSVDLRVLQGLPAAPPYRQLRPWADKLAYPKEPVGENELISITPDEDSPHIASDLEGYDLFFFGYFIFYDVFGKRRKTGFCYKIDPGIGGFFRMRLPAYDYDIEEDQ